MARKGTGWIKSIVSIFILSIILFFFLYFAKPELSFKYFGLMRAKEGDAAIIVENYLVDELELKREDVHKILALEKAKGYISEIAKGSKKSFSDLMAFVQGVDIDSSAYSAADAASEALKAAKAGAERGLEYVSGLANAVKDASSDAGADK